MKIFSVSVITSKDDNHKYALYHGVKSANSREEAIGKATTDMITDKSWAGWTINPQTWSVVEITQEYANAVFGRAN